MAIFFLPHPEKYTNLVKKTDSQESECSGGDLGDKAV